MAVFVGGVVGIKIRRIKVNFVDGFGVVNIKPAMAGVAGGKNTIKNIPAHLDHFDNFMRLADSKTVEKIIFWTIVGNNLGDIEIEFPFFG